MNDSIYRVSLDIHNTTSQVTLNAKKGDNKRRILFSLTDGDKPYIISPECTAVFRARKPDGNVLYNDCDISENVIAYDLTSQTSASTGIVECEVTLYGSDGKQITSPRFSILIEDTVYSDSEIESRNELTALNEALTEVSNINIDASKSGSKTTVTIRGKDGAEKSVDINDGARGEQGEMGVGILSVGLLSTSGLEKTYRIYLSNGQTYDFTVNDGADGAEGPQGETGAKGMGILSVSLLKTEGKEKTYRIFMTDDSTTKIYDYVVTDGADGYTPVKGIDYWTEADKEEINADNIAYISTEFEKHIVQTTGDSTTAVMSQKATTDEINALKSDIDKLDVLDLRLVRDTLGVDIVYVGGIVYDCPGGAWKLKAVNISNTLTGIVSIVIDELNVPSGGHLRVYNADKSKQFTPNITESGVRVIDLTGYTGLTLQLQVSESTACEAGIYYAKGIKIYTGDITSHIQGLPDYFVGTEKLKSDYNEFKDGLDYIYGKINNGIEPKNTTFFDIEISPNLLDLNSVTYGKYINNTNGLLANNAKYLATDFIPVTSGMTLRMQYNNGAARYDCANMPGLKPMYTAMYDSDKQYINGVSSWKTLDIPDGVHYIRTSLLISWIDGTTDYGNLAIFSSVHDTILPYYPYGEVISETIKPQHIPKEQKILHIYLPTEICVAVGRTIELYNSLVCLEANKYHLDWTCDVGTDYARKWSVTGTTANVGNHKLTLKIYDDDLNIVKTLTATVKIVNGNISQQKKILPIGDSLTNSKAWLTEVGTLSNGMFEYIGTRGTTIHHEGRSGAAAKWYNNNSSYTFDTNYNGSPSVEGSSNPFWDGTGFSLQHYLTTQSGYVDTPDAVQLLLGTNGIMLDPSENVTNIKAIVDSICTEYPTMPIFVCNTIYRSTQDGYYSTGSDGYAVGQSDFQYGADMKIMNLQNALAETFAGYENVYIIPLSVCMDRDYNFGQKEVAVNPRSSMTINIPKESVHPQNEGYMQMADVMYSSYIAYLT